MSKQSYTYREKAGAGAHAPVLFLFHGTGGDENQFFDLGAELVPNARLIAVRGDVSENGALRYFRRTGEGVFDMPDLAVRTAKMAAFIKAHIGEEKPEHVLGLGYSNGANILASVLFETPDLFDRAVLLHPLIPFTPLAQKRLKGKQLLITAGERDQICPPQRSQALADYFTAQGSDIEVVWHEGGHELRREELLAAKALFSR